MQPLHTLCRRIGNFVLLFGAMPDLHYINGPDTLPPPLTPLAKAHTCNFCKTRSMKNCGQNCSAVLHRAVENL